MKTLVLGSLVSAVVVSTFPVMSGAGAPTRSAHDGASVAGGSRDTGLSVRGVSSHGKRMKLIFPTSAVDLGTDSALVCSESPVAVRSVGLSMTEYRHAGSPTTLEPAGARCTKVGNIEFLMSGKWEMSVEFADGDWGRFRDITVS